MTSTLKLLPFPFPTDQLKHYDQPFLLSVPLYLLFLPVITASPLRTRPSFTTIQIISQILKSLQFAKSRREKRVEKFELGVVVTQIRRVVRLSAISNCRDSKLRLSELAISHVWTKFEWFWLSNDLRNSWISVRLERRTKHRSRESETQSRLSYDTE